ncbi:hypothetical protein LVD15_00355 [Fulvivirga maritima]|uniref:hypothetical protein n=1 Tax=Fulvivirga maritima TaxID=2904247 RepID=UPI001F22978D|nr:hypothetical protein [Fulvivirga maritima]UII26923.1 hypothetical protein LVD15_00355 [Fulvivirga maritima]
MIIGDKSTFAFDIDDKEIGAKILTVDIVIDNQYVCYADNSAYVPQLIASMQGDVERILQKDWSKYVQYFERKSITEIYEFIFRTRIPETDEYDIEDDNIYPFYNFLNWGPTTDNLSCFIIPHHDSFFLTYQFLDTEHLIASGKAAIQSIPVNLSDLVSIINEAIAVLKQK